MNELQEILDAHGWRNADDDLVGFYIDLEYCLGEGEGTVFSSIETSAPGEPGCMLRAVCKLLPHVTLDEAEHFVRRGWLTFLCYTQYEKHLVEYTNQGFIFHFVTLGDGLGVIGEIQCHAA